MGVDSAVRYIRALAEVPTAEGVVFVGGEPLLHLDEICELIALARSLGLETQVSTNAFWAGSDTRANRYLRRLIDAGLNHLALSADSYHSEFIDPQNVGRAFRLARDEGVVRKLQVISSRVNAEEDALYAATGIDPAECLESREFKLRRHDPDFDPRRYIIVHRNPVAPFGRGAFLHGHARLMSLASLEDFPCYMVGKFPLIYPNGDLFACCCIAGFYEPYLVGNLNETPLSELLARMSVNVVYEAISKVGPVALAKSCLKENDAAKARFANECHACRETFAMTSKEKLEERARGLLYVYDLLDGREETSFDRLV